MERSSTWSRGDLTVIHDAEPRVVETSARLRARAWGERSSRALDRPLFRRVVEGIRRLGDDDGLVDAVQRLTDTLADERRHLFSTQAERTRVMEEREEARVEVARLTAELEATKRRVDELEADRAQLRSEVERLRRPPVVGDVLADSRRARRRMQ